MKEVELSIENKNIIPYSEIKGKIQVRYSGRYDGVVINTQILNSNQLITYKSYNDKPISQNLSRLFISKENMPDGTVNFTASIEFKPEQSHDVKFRVSIIQEHKEIENDLLFAKIIV